MARKAVIWCEDHGDLAFLSRPDIAGSAEGFLDVGDVVEFDLNTKRTTRSVQNLKVISEGRGKALVDTLKPAHRPDVGAHDPGNSAEVIPFRLSAAARLRPVAPAAVQRSG